MNQPMQIPNAAMIEIEAGEGTQFYEVDHWYRSYTYPAQRAVVSFVMYDYDWLSHRFRDLWLRKVKSAHYVIEATVTSNDFSAAFGGYPVHLMTGRPSPRINDEVGNGLKVSQSMYGYTLAEVIGAGAARLLRDDLIIVEDTYWSYLRDGKHGWTTHAGLYQGSPLALDLLRSGVALSTLRLLAGKALSAWSEAIAEIDIQEAIRETYVEITGRFPGRSAFLR